MRSKIKAFPSKFQYLLSWSRTRIILKISSILWPKYYFCTSFHCFWYWHSWLVTISEYKVLVHCWCMFAIVNVEISCHLLSALISQTLSAMRKNIFHQSIKNFANCYNCRRFFRITEYIFYLREYIEVFIKSMTYRWEDPCSLSVYAYD